jgi:hypothetical protein
MRTGGKKLGGLKVICPTFFAFCAIYQKIVPCKIAKILVGGGGIFEGLKEILQTLLISCIFDYYLTFRLIISPSSIPPHPPRTQNTCNKISQNKE